MDTRCLRASQHGIHGETRLVGAWDSFQGVCWLYPCCGKEVRVVEGAYEVSNIFVFPYISNLLYVDIHDIQTQPFTRAHTHTHNRGVGTMEMVAMEMKQRGTYIARQLSFKGVSFKVQEAQLSRDYMHMYNQAVKLVCLLCVSLFEMSFF